MPTTLYARAKINWALNITGRRDDGYHLLDMLMQSIELSDELTVRRSDETRLSVNGAPAPEGRDNLVARAARALNRYTGLNHCADMALVKRVPARAGLGGGSADCAAALIALNEEWRLGLEGSALRRIGLSLGADVPFCLTGGLARVSGIGERIEPIADAPEIPLVLVTPGGGLSTAEVFRLWDEGDWPGIRLDTAALADAVCRRDLGAVDRLCANALTAPAISLMPQIGRMIDRMRSLGAGTSFMTGSGSTVVGAFEDADLARRAADAIPGAILTRTLPTLSPCVHNGNLA